MNLTELIQKSHESIRDFILSSNDEDLELISISEDEIVFKIINSEFKLKHKIDEVNRKVYFYTSKLYWDGWCELEYLDMSGNDKGICFVNGMKPIVARTLWIKDHYLPHGVLKNFGADYVNEMALFRANYI